MTISRRLASLTIATVCGMAMVGCGTGAKHVNGGSSDPTIAVSPSPSESAPPSSTPTAATVPAGWRVAAVDGVAQFAVPPRWDLKSSRNMWSIGIAKDQLGIPPGFATYSVSPGIGGDVKSYVASLGKEHVHGVTVGGAKGVKRLPDVTFAGSLFYHIQYGGDGMVHDDYGTTTLDGTKVISIGWSTYPDTITRKQADQIINQVMATFKLL